MIVVLKKGIGEAEKQEVRRFLEQAGFDVREIVDQRETVLAALGRAPLDRRTVELFSGVERVLPIHKPYTLVSREARSEDTVISIGPVRIGGGRVAVIAGPCTVESRQQIMAAAKAVREAGAVMLRGGAFKPRTSPYSFQGMGEEGLKILAEARERYGMPVVTEITTPAQADLVMKYVDVVQVGARNMQNFELLKSVGRLGKPVLLKRGLSATIEEWLMSAEYILAEGNENVILCERGIRTFEPYTRNTLDLSAIPVIKKLTHLPVIIDPSHATGIREKVSPMARAAIAAEADGLMIEVHNDPDRASSDGAQSLYPEQFGQLMRDIYVIAPVVDKQVDFGYLDKATAVEHMAEAAGGQGQRAAFLGEVGSFSHKACTQFFGDQVTPLPVDSFRGLFESVKSGATTFGVVPLENSLAGSVHENYDLLLEYDLRIVGEITLRIKHNLIGHPGAKVDEIKRVYSHPQVFQQCRQFLERHGNWDIVTVSDTARAVGQIKEKGDAAEAAIAGKDAAEIFGMTVMEEGIETNPRNFTRFVVIGKQGIESGVRQKSSIIFSTGNQPGSLFEVLKIFAENGINLVKLESRPIHGKPWEYMFYVDLEADVDAPEFQPIFEQLSANADYLKVLGSY